MRGPGPLEGGRGGIRSRHSQPSGIAHASHSRWDCGVDKEKSSSGLPSCLLLVSSVLPGLVTGPGTRGTRGWLQRQAAAPRLVLLHIYREGVTGSREGRRVVSSHSTPASARGSSDVDRSTCNDWLRGCKQAVFLLQVLCPLTCRTGTST